MGSYISWETGITKVEGETIFEMPETELVDLGANSLWMFDEEGKLVPQTGVIYIDSRFFANK